MPLAPCPYHKLLKIRFYFKRNMGNRLKKNFFLIREVKNLIIFSVLLKK